MPKVTYNFESEDKIPAEFKPFANGTTVEIWANKSDLDLAAETNPTLETHKQTILGEKRTLQQQYDALKTASTDEAVDKAKLIVERDAALRNAKTPEEVELLQSVQTVFANTPLSEVKTKLPTLKEASEKVSVYEQEKKHASLFKASGFKNEQVFLDLLSNPAKMQGLEGEPFVKTVGEGENAKPQLFAKIKNATGAVEEKPFNDFVNASEAWKPYLPSLTNGTVQEGQTWIPSNPIIDGQNQTTKNASQVRIEEHNKAQQAAVNPFTAHVPQVPAGQQQQNPFTK